jgi:hypothetical protein
VTFQRNGYVFKKPMRITLPAVALALLVAGCGSAQETPSTGAEPTIVSVPPEELTTEIVGATPKQEEVLLEALSGVGDRRIETITVAEAKWAGEPGEVSVSFRPRPKAADDMRMTWEAQMIGEAFALRSQELGLPSVASIGVPGMVSAVGPLNPDPAARTEQRVRTFADRVVNEAELADADVRQIEILRPLGYAIAVTLQVSDPATFLDRRAPRLFERLGEPPGEFELSIVDSDGARVAENWNAGSTGSVWVRRDLDGCSPYLVSRPVAYKPPPCLVEPEDSEDPEVETVPPAKLTTTIVGATPKQRTIIEQTLAGLGPTQIDSVHVYQKVDQSLALATPESVGIDVKFRNVDAFTSWQAQVVGYVFGRESLALGLQPVAFVGVNEDRSAGLDFSEDLKERPMTRSEADKALRHSAEIAAAHGASTRARVFEPSRLAFAIEFRTAKPGEFLRHGLKPALAPIESGGTEGDQVTVVDARGEHVLETGRGVWVRWALRSCAPYAWFGSPSRPEPPPCPVK